MPTATLPITNRRVAQTKAFSDQFGHDDFVLEASKLCLPPSAKSIPQTPPVPFSGTQENPSSPKTPFVNSPEATNQISSPGNFWLSSSKAFIYIYIKKQYLCFRDNKVA